MTQEEELGREYYIELTLILVQGKLTSASKMLFAFSFPIPDMFFKNYTKNN